MNFELLLCIMDVSEFMEHAEPKSIETKPLGETQNWKWSTTYRTLEHRMAVNKPLREVATIGGFDYRFEIVRDSDNILVFRVEGALSVGGEPTFDFELSASTDDEGNDRTILCGYNGLIPFNLEPARVELEESWLDGISQRVLGSKKDCPIYFNIDLLIVHGIVSRNPGTERVCTKEWYGNWRNEQDPATRNMLEFLESELGTDFEITVQQHPRSGGCDLCRDKGGRRDWKESKMQEEQEPEQGLDAEEKLYTFRAHRCILDRYFEVWANVQSNEYKESLKKDGLKDLGVCSNVAEAAVMWCYVQKIEEGVDLKEACEFAIRWGNYKLANELC